ncbi:MAG: class I SAM-dependent methyltransferase [Chloroflexi bacterium]|nr:class I SAM-dependent methyltransferase [Chloroflexota bacterium]
MTTSSKCTVEIGGASVAQYAFDQPWEEERQRLVLLEEAHDPVTIRQLEAVEVGKGWRCAEVGAGAGSIARWLAERVGATGRVIALDLDTRFLDAASYTNLEVRRQDIVHDPLEEGAYDLIHARYLLMHLMAERLLGSHHPSSGAVRRA